MTTPPAEPRFHVVQDESSACWIVISAKDDGLGSTGSFWADMEQASSRVIRFADEDTAERYARETFGGE